MADTIVLQIKLEDGTTEVLEFIKEQMDEFFSGVKEGAAQALGELDASSGKAGQGVQKLGRESVASGQSVERATRGMADGFGQVADRVSKTAMAFAALSGAGITKFISQAVSYGSMINNMAIKTGLTTQELGRLKLAAEKTDTSLQYLTFAMQFLGRSMTEAAGKSKSDAAEAFKKLGINVKDASGKMKEGSAVFYEMIANFGKLKTAAERNAAVFAIFGARMGRELTPLLSMGSAEFDKMAKMADKLGIAMGPEQTRRLEQLQGTIIEVKNAFSGLWIQISDTILPTLKKLAESWRDILIKFKEWVKDHPALVEAISKVVGNLLKFGLIVAPVMLLIKSVKMLRAELVALGVMKFVENLKNAFTAGAAAAFVRAQALSKIAAGAASLKAAKMAGMAGSMMGVGGAAIETAEGGLGFQDALSTAGSGATIAAAGLKQAAGNANAAAGAFSKMKIMSGALGGVLTTLGKTVLPILIIGAIVKLIDVIGKAIDAQAKWKKSWNEMMTGADAEKWKEVMDSMLDEATTKQREWLDLVAAAKGGARKAEAGGLLGLFLPKKEAVEASKKSVQELFAILAKGPLGLTQEKLKENLEAGAYRGMKGIDEQSRALVALQKIWDATTKKIEDRGKAVAVVTATSAEKAKAALLSWAEANRKMVDAARWDPNLSKMPAEFAEKVKEAYDLLHPAFVNLSTEAQEMMKEVGYKTPAMLTEMVNTFAESYRALADAMGEGKATSMMGEQIYNFLEKYSGQMKKIGIEVPDILSKVAGGWKENEKQIEKQTEALNRQIAVIEQLQSRVQDMGAQFKDYARGIGEELKESGKELGSKFGEAFGASVNIQIDWEKELAGIQRQLDAASGKSPRKLLKEASVEAAFDQANAPSEATEKRIEEFKRQYQALEELGLEYAKIYETQRRAIEKYFDEEERKWVREVANKKREISLVSATEETKAKIVEAAQRKDLKAMESLRLSGMEKLEKIEMEGLAGIEKGREAANKKLAEWAGATMDPAMKKIREAQAALTASFDGVVGAGEIAAKTLASIFAAAAKNTKDAWTTALSGLSIAFRVLSDKMMQDAEKIRASISSTMTAGERAKINKRADRMEIGAGLMTGLGTLLGEWNQGRAEGKSFGESVTPEAVGGIGAGFGGLISGKKANYGGTGASIGGVLGNALLPGIGGLIGAGLGGLLGGLLGPKNQRTAEEQAAEELKQKIESINAVYSKFGKISDETGQKIQEASKKMMQSTATAKYFADMMRDWGVNQKNINSLWDEAGKTILPQWRAGLLNLTDTQKALGDSFVQLIEHAKEFGTEGSKAMTDFIRETIQSGIRVKEMDQYMQDQLGVRKAGKMTAVEGLVGMVGGIRPKSTALAAAFEGMGTTGVEMDKVQAKLAELKAPAGLDDLVKKFHELSDAGLSEEANKVALQIEEMAKTTKDFDVKGYVELKNQLRDLEKEQEKYKKTIAGSAEEAEKYRIKGKAQLAGVEKQTMAVFNAMIFSGASFREAIDSISPALDAIIKKHKELGTEATGPIKELLKIRKVTQDYKELFDAIDGNKAVLEALANTASLTQESFDIAAGNAVDYYNQLKDAFKGAGSDDLLASNQALAQMAPTLGKLRDLAKQHGYALDDNTKKLIEEAEKQGLLAEEAYDSNKLMMEGFAAIIAALGGQLPEAWAKYLKDVKKSSDEIGGTGSDGVDKIVDVLDKELEPQSKDTFDKMKGDITSVQPYVSGLETALYGSGVGGALEKIGTVQDTVFGEMKIWTDEAVGWIGALEKAIDGVGAAFERVKFPALANDGGVPMGQPAANIMTDRAVASEIKKGDERLLGKIDELIETVKVGLDIEINPVLIPSERAQILEFVKARLEAGDWVKLPKDSIQGSSL